MNAEQMIEIIKNAKSFAEIEDKINKQQFYTLSLADQRLVQKAIAAKVMK